MTLRLSTRSRKCSNFSFTSENQMESTKLLNVEDISAANDASVSALQVNTQKSVLAQVLSLGIFALHVDHVLSHDEQINDRCLFRVTSALPRDEFQVAPFDVKTLLTCPNSSSPSVSYNLLNGLAVLYRSAGARTSRSRAEFCRCSLSAHPNHDDSSLC